jgi:hypothetical protein
VTGYTSSDSLHSRYCRTFAQNVQTWCDIFTMNGMNDEWKIRFEKRSPGSFEMIKCLLLVAVVLVVAVFSLELLQYGRSDHNEIVNRLKKEGDTNRDLRVIPQVNVLVVRTRATC